MSFEQPGPPGVSVQACVTVNAEICKIPRFMKVEKRISAHGLLY